MRKKAAHIPSVLTRSWLPAPIQHASETPARGSTKGAPKRPRNVAGSSPSNRRFLRTAVRGKNIRGQPRPGDQCPSIAISERPNSSSKKTPKQDAEVSLHRSPGGKNLPIQASDHALITPTIYRRGDAEPKRIQGGPEKKKKVGPKEPRGTGRGEEGGRGAPGAGYQCARSRAEWTGGRCWQDRPRRRSDHTMRLRRQPAAVTGHRPGSGQAWLRDDNRDGRSASSDESRGKGIKQQICHSSWKEDPYQRPALHGPEARVFRNTQRTLAVASGSALPPSVSGGLSLRSFGL